MHKRPRISRRQSQLLVAALTASVSCVSVTCHGQSRTETVVETQQPTGTDGEFSIFIGIQLNNASQVSFRSTLQNTSGGTADDLGLFLWEAGIFSQIAREGQAAPGTSGGNFSDFFPPQLNNSGQIAFRGIMTNTSASTNDGVFLHNGLALVETAREGGVAPGTSGGNFGGLNAPLLNDSGQITFKASNMTNTSTGTNNGIFLHNGSALVEIARAGQAAPGTSGGNFVIVTFAPLQLNNVGKIAFQSPFITNTSTATDDGIFLHNGSTLVEIVREGGVAPGTSGGNFGFSDIFQLNDSGQVAFRSLIMTNTSAATDEGIFLHNGSALVEIAREGGAAPGTSGGNFGFPDIPQLNDSGQVAFMSSAMTNTSAATDEGIFLHNGSALVEIVREGGVAPGASGGNFGSPILPQLNDSGQVAFFASSMTNTSAATDQGIFIGDGIDLFQIARKGDALGGGTVTDVGIVEFELNDLGQVAYQATLDDAREFIQLYTPDLYYRQSTVGSWEDSSNWTLSLKPGHVHNVFIDPDISVNIIGPSGDVSVRNLEIGGGNGIATLDLNGGNLQSQFLIRIQATGVLRGDGTVTGTVSNLGTIVAENLTVNGDLVNTNEIRGDGRINVSGFLHNQFIVKGNVDLKAAGGITNASTGQFRVAAGESMRVSGFSNSFTNQGTLEVIGGELEMQGPATNSANTGLITLRDAKIRFNDGQLNSGLTNDGAIGVTFGTSDIFGDITNTSTGVINIAGGANATFYDDVMQNGTMIVASVGQTHGAAVFFGSFGGTGGFTGGGDVFAFGDLRPGASPASVLMDGNLFLGPTTNTAIELGGLDLGEFDQMVVTGDLTLGGELLIDLIDGFQLKFNDEFLIADVEGALLGQFAGLDDGGLVGNFDGMNLFITYAGGNGNDVALFTTGLPGDFDSDGDVDGADFLVWQRGEVSNPASAEDLTDWQDYFGTVASPITAASTAVPEPSGIAIVIGMVVLLSGGRTLVSKLNCA